MSTLIGCHPLSLMARGDPSILHVPVYMYHHADSVGILLLFTKLETAEFSPFLTTVNFTGNYTSPELVVQFVTKSEPNS